jgi:hypothetical protein
MLDFVQPAGPGRRVRGGRWEAWGNEPGGQDTRTQRHGHVDATGTGTSQGQNGRTLSAVRCFVIVLRGCRQQGRNTGEGNTAIPKIGHSRTAWDRAHRKFARR